MKFIEDKSANTFFDIDCQLCLDFLNRWPHIASLIQLNWSTPKIESMLNSYLLDDNPKSKNTFSANDFSAIMKLIDLNTSLISGKYRLNADRPPFTF